MPTLRIAMSNAEPVLCGMASDILGVLWVTTIQREIPEHVISRVSSYDLLASLSFAPLGLLIAGPLAAATSPRAALLGCAALVATVTLVALTSPAVRQLRAPGPERAVGVFGR
jgi:hypothetical protein